jgi:prepilin-type N-terminal cleavage/methylation domain-containing protein
MFTPKPRRTRHGFTLVEILVVIVIIGILAGLAIPAAQGVIKKANNTAIKVEIDLLGQALEAYKLRHGNYPPDFSDWAKVERHFRKAFPQIADDELKILAQFTHLDRDFRRVPSGSTTDPRTTPAVYSHYRQCIDPAEALVFALGGFSSDSRRPFTGPGGPLLLVTGGTEGSYSSYQYNINRENFDFEFGPDGLSLDVVNGPDWNLPVNPLGSGIYSYSVDEMQSSVNAGSASGNLPIQGDYSVRAKSTAFDSVHYLMDPFPIYKKGSDTNPLVYFASDSYQSTFTPKAEGWLAGANPWHNLNYFAPASGEIEEGVSRPYKSNQIDTSDGFYQWAESNRYQIQSPGKDNSFGGEIAAGVFDSTDATTQTMTREATGVVTIFPTGKTVDALGPSTSHDHDRYEEHGGLYGRETPQLDNIASFSKLTFEDELE